MQARCCPDRFCVSYQIVSLGNSSISFFCLLGQWYPLPHLFFLYEQGSQFFNLEVFYNQSKEKICGCWICKELKRERLKERFVQVSKQGITSGRNRRALEILQEKLNEAQESKLPSLLGMLGWMWVSIYWVSISWDQLFPGTHLISFPLFCTFTFSHSPLFEYKPSMFLVLPES